MAMLRNKNSHSWFNVRKLDAPVHIKQRADLIGKSGFYQLPGETKVIELPLNAHKKVVIVTVNVLFQIDDIAVVSR
jgi:hypothetical protein